jgi:hypothetical protein
MGQGKRPDEEPIVSGTGRYASCETIDGFPAIYDDFLKRFCYARLAGGAYESTGMPVTCPPLPDILWNAKNRTRSAGA